MKQINIVFDYVWFVNDNLMFILHEGYTRSTMPMPIILRINLN